MIIKKEFYVVSCDCCGEHYSGAPDCGFTVYDTKQAAIESMQLEGWIVEETTDDILCPDCHAEKMVIHYLSTPGDSEVPVYLPDLINPQD